MAEHAVRLDELARWLRDRQQNCLRLAATKLEIEQIGWLEDARHFAAAVAVCDWASDNGMAQVSPEQMMEQMKDG